MSFVGVYVRASWRQPLSMSRSLAMVEVSVKSFAELKCGEGCLKLAYKYVR